MNILNTIVTVISSVIAFVSAVVVARIQSKSEINKVREEWQKKEELSKAEHERSMSKLREEWQDREDSELDKEFQQAMKLVSYFIGSGRVEKNSSAAAVTSLSFKCTGELANTLYDLADAIRSGNAAGAKSLQRRAIEQYRNHRIVK